MLLAFRLRVRSRAWKTCANASIWVTLAAQATGFASTPNKKVVTDIVHESRARTFLRKLDPRPQMERLKRSLGAPRPETLNSTIQTLYQLDTQENLTPADITAAQSTIAELGKLLRGKTLRLNPNYSTTSNKLPKEIKIGRIRCLACTGDGRWNIMEAGEREHIDESARFEVEVIVTKGLIHSETWGIKRLLNYQAKGTKRR